jgi:DNA-binding protein Fis
MGSDLLQDSDNQVTEAPLSVRLRALDVVAGDLVGIVGVDLSQNRVKTAMLREALLRTHGNLTRAAHLLGVKRQAVQQMVDRYDLKAWTTSLRGDVASRPTGQRIPAPSNAEGELKAS